MKTFVQSVLAICVCAVAVSGQSGPVRENLPGVNNFFRVDDTMACGGAMQPEVAAELRARGYKAVINLRSADESGANEPQERAAVEAAKLRYVHIPTNRANPLTHETITAVLAAVGNPANRPAFLHCGSGHRVSGFWLIKRVRVDKWPLDRALAEAEALGLSGPLKDRAIELAKE